MGTINRSKGTQMTREEIKTAVDAGKSVHWCNEGYKVVKDKLYQYQVVFEANGYCAGLDGFTDNELIEFYIGTNRYIAAN